MLNHDQRRRCRQAYMDRRRGRVAPKVAELAREFNCSESTIRTWQLRENTGDRANGRPVLLRDPAILLLDKLGRLAFEDCCLYNGTLGRKNLVELAAVLAGYGRDRLTGDEQRKNRQTLQKYVRNGAFSWKWRDFHLHAKLSPGLPGLIVFNGRGNWTLLELDPGAFRTKSADMPETEPPESDWPEMVEPAVPDEHLESLDTIAFPSALKRYSMKDLFQGEESQHRKMEALFQGIFQDADPVQTASSTVDPDGTKTFQHWLQPAIENFLEKESRADHEIFAGLAFGFILNRWRVSYYWDHKPADLNSLINGVLLFVYPVD